MASCFRTNQQQDKTAPCKKWHWRKECNPKLLGGHDVLRANAEFIAPVSIWLTRPLELHPRLRFLLLGFRCGFWWWLLVGLLVLSVLFYRNLDSNSLFTSTRRPAQPLHTWPLHPCKKTCCLLQATPGFRPGSGYILASTFKFSLASGSHGTGPKRPAASPCPCPTQPPIGGSPVSSQIGEFPVSFHQQAASPDVVLAAVARCIRGGATRLHVSFTHATTFSC